MVAMGLPRRSVIATIGIATSTPVRILVVSLDNTISEAKLARCPFRDDGISQ